MRSSGYFLDNLVKFLEQRLDLLDRFLDILQRVGVTQAQIAFAETAEAVTRQQGHVGFFEDQISDLRGAFPGPLNIWEDVKSALGFLAAETRNGVQPVHDRVPAALILRHHLSHFVLRASDRLNASELGEVGC